MNTANGNFVPCWTSAYCNIGLTWRNIWESRANDTSGRPCLEYFIRDVLFTGWYNIDNCRYVCYHGWWIWWWRCPCPIYIICMPISLRTTFMMSPSYGSLRSQYSCAYFQSYDFLQIPFWSIIDLNSRLTTMAVVRLDRMITFVITK